MKYPVIRAICALILCASVVSCRPSAMDYAEPTWSADLQSAIQRAQGENKALMIYFAGSDWSAPCIDMQKQVFNTAAFKDFADNHIVIYMADFPRYKKLPQNVQDANDKIAKSCGITGYPTVALINPNPQPTRVTNIGGNPGNPSTLINQIIAAFSAPAPQK